jgi:hypothetical protein
MRGGRGSRPTCRGIVNDASIGGRTEGEQGQTHQTLVWSYRGDAGAGTASSCARSQRRRGCTSVRTQRTVVSLVRSHISTLVDPHEVCVLGLGV